MRITQASLKLASIPGHKPSPAKPINPNAIKPIMLGLPQDQSGGADAALMAEQQQKSWSDQQKATEEASKARLSAQQAQQEASLAKQQLSLAKQQQQAAMQASTGAGGLNSALLSKSLSRIKSKLDTVSKRTLTDRVSRLKLSADTRKIINPNVKPYNSAGEWNTTAKQHGVDPSGKPGGFWRGVGETIKNPDQADYSVLSGKWNPMSGNYRPGSVGSYLAPVVNTAANMPRHSMRSLPRTGGTLLGAMSFPVQTLGKVWDAGRDMVGEFQRHGLNARPQDSPYLQEMGELARRSVAPALGSVGTMSPYGMASLLGFHTADSLAEEETGKGVIEWLMSKMTGGDKPAEAPAATEDQSSSGQAGDVVAWLQNLISQAQSYATKPDLAQRLRALLPSQAGASGHIVRNPSNFY